jgi:hypothetical protein
VSSYIPFLSGLYSPKKAVQKECHYGYTFCCFLLYTIFVKNPAFLKNFLKIFSLAFSGRQRRH